MIDTPRTDALVVANKALSNLEAHNRMLDHARDLERELAAWAPMSQGRPAYLLGVLLYFSDTRAMAVGCLDVDDRWCVGGERAANTPTHWMPLPEAPK